MVETPGGEFLELHFSPCAHCSFGVTLPHTDIIARLQTMAKQVERGSKAVGIGRTIADHS